MVTNTNTIIKELEKKEDTNRLVLQRVIQWLDGNGHSNTRMRRVVDMVLNHDADYERAINVANREADINASYIKD
tara:strand:- start:38 stop:262 length:225 start_codon:yes stop_codon:yes gene_type:complete